jgi:hypothetical protein
MNPASCTSLYVKKCCSKTQSLTLRKFKSLPERYAFRDDTWRKESKSRILKAGHPFSQLPWVVSAHSTLQERIKKDENTHYFWKCSLILLLKMHFSLSNEVFDYRERYEQLRNNDLQNPWKQKTKTAVHTVAATTSLYDTRVVAASGGSLRSLAGRISQAVVRVLVIWSLVDNPEGKGPLRRPRRSLEDNN